MKTLKILLVTLLLTSSAYAWGKNERNALLGFGAGVLVSHIINQNNHFDKNFNTRVSYNNHAHYEQPRRVHKAKKHYHQKKHHRKMHKHHRRAHNKHRRDNVVVVNRYRNNYYY